MDNSKAYKEIILKLGSFYKKEKFFEILSKLFFSLILILLLFLLFTLIELIGKFDSSARTVFFFIWLLFSSFALIYFSLISLTKFLIRLSKGINPGRVIDKALFFEIARKVGNFFPSVKDELLNSIQLANTNADERNYYSYQLTEAAFSNIYGKTKDLNFLEKIQTKTTKKKSIAFFSIFFFSTLFFSFISPLRSASERLLNYNTDYISPPKFVLQVEPGDLEITKDENVLISVKVTGDRPKEILLAVKNEEETEYKSKEILFDSSSKKFTLLISNVRRSFKYFAYSGDIKSDEFSVKVIDRPIIKKFEVVATPPAYSGLPQIIQSDNGNISSLKGTKINITLNASKELSDAFLQFSDSTFLKLQINSYSAEGSFTIEKNGSYKIFLKDQSQKSNAFPITYSVEVIEDKFPLIKLLQPAENINLNQDQRLPFLIQISDDFGFTKFLLHYRLSSSKYEMPQKNFSSFEIPLTASTGKEQKEKNINYIWNLSSLNLATEDVISYYLEIFDNDNISGPKSAKTEVLSLRVPSIEEIFAETEKDHNIIEDELVNTLKEAVELKKELEKIEMELKKDERLINYDEKQKLESSLEKFDRLQEKVNDVKEKLDERRSELQQNDLLSEETLQKYLELQKLLDELDSEEMRKAMERLQNALQKLNRENVQQALKDIKFNEEYFQKSLERTINLLKRVQIEQKVDEILKRIEQLLEDQKSISEKTENKNLSDNEIKEQLSSEQEEVTDKLDRLEEEMNSLKEKMNDLKPTDKNMPSEKMEELLEKFNEQQNQKLSEEASEKIKMEQQDNASQIQSQISQNMQQMKEQIGSLQQSILQQNQMQTFTDLMKAIKKTLELSKEQEELKKETESAAGSSKLNEYAQKQNEMQSKLESLFKDLNELSQKTFAITPEMGKALGNSMKQMHAAQEAILNRNSSLAVTSQNGAMSSLNEAASLMKSSMESMMQGNGQGGMMSLMQQMGQLSQQQMNLNNLTQMLSQNNGKFTMEQMAQLERLAQQQEIIRKSLSQLNKEAKQSGRSESLAANLEKILEEMTEVIKDMNTQKLDDELIQKQENILSKMLDAQRSINERDYEKERESESGENIIRESPAEIKFSNDELRNKIIDELKTAIKEGYTKDYEELIKKYFEALQRGEDN